MTNADEILTLLNALAAFASGETVTAASSETILRLEDVAQRMAARPVCVDEACMDAAVGLLETLPPASAAMRALVMYLANACLGEENRDMACRFGVPSMCVLLLHQHAAVPTRTLYYLLDLVSTLAASHGTSRQMLRPCIPYVIAVLRGSDVLSLSFACCVALSTLAMLDDANCTLILQCNGLQALIDAHRRAQSCQERQRTRCAAPALPRCTRPPSAALSKTTSASSATPRRDGHAEADVDQLCADVLRWSKDVLLKLCHTSGDVVDARLREADFGRFGECVAMDELKWLLVFERKKRSKAPA